MRTRMRADRRRRVWASSPAIAAGLLLLCFGADAADYTFLQDRGEGDYTLVFDLPHASGWQEGAEIRIAFDYESAEAFHVACLTKGAVWLEETGGAGSRRIGSAGTWPLVTGDTTVSIKRRAWEMEVLVNGRTVAKAHDEEPYGGKVGVSAAGIALSADDILVQPVEPPRLSDDFMREPGERGPWQIGLGEWQNVGLAGGKGRLRADLSANPFSLRCHGTGPQLATAGDWHWDSYSVSAAVKATEAGGAIGIAFYVQDPRNYYLLSLGHRGLPGSSQERLIKVVDGTPQVLDAAIGGYDKDIWYKLTVRTSNGLIEGYVDGRRRLRIYDTTFGQGPVGLWARDAGHGWFDDVEVGSWWAFADPLAGNDLSLWVQGGGQWTAGNGALRATSTFEHPATIMMGPKSWRGYEIAADVLPGDAEGVGLYACADGPTNWYLFRWSDGSPMGTWQLLKMSDGRPTSLGLVAGDIDRDSPQRLSMTVADGLIDCRIDGQPAIIAADFTRATGGVGLRADGGRDVTFSNITVRVAEEPYRSVSITKQFAQEATMSDWARPSSDWPRDPQTGVRWFRLPFFGDLSVRIPFRQAASGPSRLTLRVGSVMEGEGYMAGGPQLYSPGLEVEYAGAAGGSVTVVCRRGGEVLAQAEVPADASQHLARIDKAGLALRAWLDDKPVLAVNDGTWLDNSAVGITGEGATVNVNRVETYSTHMPEYTFSGAPTDWLPTLGVWQVTDRWSCFPGWAWFGGSRHQSPLLWSKRQFYGDQTFEFWAGIEMDTVPRRGGYSHPSDINCTIAGDGKNLCSGYSFVFAGDNNTTTKILRGNTVVAQADAVRFTNPTTGNFDFHRHWFHIKVVKIGSDLHMSVDGKWVLQWRDPQPILGGHVAIWTYNNGIVIAKARATAQIVR